MLIDLNKKEHLDTLAEVVQFARQWKDPPKPKPDAVSRLAAVSQPTLFEQVLKGLKFCAAAFPADESTDEHHREIHEFFYGRS